MQQAYVSLMKSWESYDKDCAENEGGDKYALSNTANVKPWKIRTFKATNGPVSIARAFFFHINRYFFAYNLIVWLNCD